MRYRICSRLRAMLFTLALFVVLNSSSYACTYFSPGPPQAYCQAAAVFIGTVTDISPAPEPGERDPQNKVRTFRFSVEESFRGVQNEPVEIVAGGYWCAPFFHKATSYLIYAGRIKNDNRFFVTEGNRIMPASRAKDDLKFLRSLPRAGSGGNVIGWLNWKSWEALSGIKIILNGQPQWFETTTDERGSFQFMNVPPGTYKMSTVGLPQGLFQAIPYEITVEPNGCSDLEIKVKGKLNGSNKK